MQIVAIPYAELRLSSTTFTNPRAHTGLDEAEIRELALHIGRHGLRIPLTVTDEGVITAGQRRYHAIGLVLLWRTTLIDQIAPMEHGEFDRCAAELEAGVPCTRETAAAADLLAAALADNLTRTDMSTFDVAANVTILVERGLSMRAIANKIGRDETYLYKLATCFAGAAPEVKAAWSANKLSYHHVRELAELGPDAQRTTLARMLDPDPERRPRSKHTRPSAAILRATLVTLRRRLETRPNDPYLAGVVAALRVVTGAAPMTSLVEAPPAPADERPEPTHPAMVTSYDEKDDEIVPKWMTDP